MKNLLDINNLYLTYHSKIGETQALSELSFSVENQEFVSMVGPSGCGKTTILSLIAGLLTPSSGEILLDGKKIERINTDIGYMFQRDNLFDWLTVEKNVLFALKLQKKLTEENKSFVYTLVEKYGLADFLNHYPSELSGGMRQRVSLIRTLATRPKLLLLDEPFSALDYQTRLEIQNIVHKIILDEKQTAILVTHDIGEAIAMSKRIVILSKRPARVKRIVEIEFPEGLTPFEKRSHPNYNNYFNIIWEELKNEE